MIEAVDRKVEPIERIPQTNKDGDAYVPSEQPVGAGLYKDKPSPVAKRLEATTPLDVQVGGTHYKLMPIQPVEFAMENGLNYCQANAIKYICRYQLKNGIEDLNKALHYIDLLLQFESKGYHQFFNLGYKISIEDFVMKNQLNYLQGVIINLLCVYKTDGIHKLVRAKEELNKLIQLEYGDVKDQGLQTK